MHFIHPIYFLVACLLIIAVPIIATIAGVRRKKALRTLLGSSLDDSLAVKCSYAARRFRIFFLLMAMVFLAIAATRPFWSSKMVPFESKGRDLLILFDVSKSMLASDIAPSRLAHARFILRELVKGDPLDRFGLVAFAGTESEKYPSMSAVVPIVVPATTTPTPATGWPFSSTTCPLTVTLSA